MPANTNQAFEENLRYYPGERCALHTGTTTPGVVQTSRHVLASLPLPSARRIAYLHYPNYPSPPRSPPRPLCCCRYPKKKKEWAVDVHDSILSICKLHPSQRPPMVRPEDDNELGQQDVDAFIKNLVENGQPVVKAEGLGKGSLSADPKGKKVKGAPEGVEANNFDGQRSFDASAFGM